MRAWAPLRCRPVRRHAFEGELPRRNIIQAAGDRFHEKLSYRGGHWPFAIAELRFPFWPQSRYGSGSAHLSVGLKMISLSINGRSHNVDVEDDTPLLWVLRDTIGMTGTKYGCGIAQCGACTVHVNGAAMRSCSIPVSTVAGKQITTIEAIAVDGKLSAVQQAWLDNDVPQCGYCQSGMIMAVTALLKQKPKPTDADIDAAITNICRCGTYQQIRAAIHAAANA
jgi:isoquinoline 1-oxidoreductase alpha subunit